METPSVFTLSEVVQWADKHNFYLVPMVSAYNGVCAIHGADCKGKHPKYKKETVWSMNREKLFLIDCGLSHILVMDVDPRNGGMESLVHLMGMCGELNPEIIVRTGSGGYHYYYADWVRPERYKSGSIMPGIDIKTGQNSFIVCPGMPHHSGNYYKLIKDGIPADMPEPLETLVLKSCAPKQKKNTSLITRTSPVLFDLLDMSKFKETGQGWRGPHPVHGSTTGTNFIVTPDGTFWHCWQHGSSGGRRKLEQMIRGELTCEGC
jgi:hypothetical protein